MKNIELEGMYATHTHTNSIIDGKNSFTDAIAPHKQLQQQQSLIGLNRFFVNTQRKYRTEKRGVTHRMHKKTDHRNNRK